MKSNSLPQVQEQPTLEQLRMRLNHQKKMNQELSHVYENQSKEIKS